MNEFIVSTGSGNKVISSDNGSRGRVSRKGSRMGYTTVDGKSPIEYLKMLHSLQGFPDQHDIITSGDEDAAEEYLRENLELDGSTYEAELRSIVEEYEEGQREGHRKGSRRGNLDDEPRSRVLEEHDKALKNVEKIASMYGLELDDRSHAITSYKRSAVSVDGERYPYGSVTLKANGYGFEGSGVINVGTIILSIWIKGSEFDFTGITDTYWFDGSTTSIDIPSYLDKLGLKLK